MKGATKEDYNLKVLSVVLITAFVVVFICGFLAVNGASSEWYKTVKSPFAPSGFVFGTIWALMFILISASGYYVWLAAFQKEKGKITAFFTINFALAILWSFLFFGLREVLFAFYCSLVLSISALVLVWYLWGIERKGGFLLLLYLIWTGFLVLINYATYIRGVIN